MASAKLVLGVLQLLLVVVLLLLRALPATAGGTIVCYSWLCCLYCCGTVVCYCWIEVVVLQR
jgi:TRAP-type C4-dicarboxylate transport system permease small subunit